MEKREEIWWIIHPSYISYRISFLNSIYGFFIIFILGRTPAISVTNVLEYLRGVGGEFRCHQNPEVLNFYGLKDEVSPGRFVN